MKAIIQSYTPQECGRIINGRQTIKVCKTVSEDTPFKVYIYCTSVKNMPLAKYVEVHKKTNGRIDCWHGKVIGEYVCEKVDKYRFSNYEAEYNVTHVEMSQMCLNQPELIAYGKGEPLRGLHISDLKIYDKPKELDEFFGICPTDDCVDCDYLGDNGMFNFCTNKIIRPPCGWQYVKDLQCL